MALAWPSWWSDEAESSPSACAELRFTLARKLGLDARALIEGDEPRFVWRTATFKAITATGEAERDAIVSYGTSVARALLNGVAESRPFPSASAQEVRRLLLGSAEVVTLPDILTFCWAVGLPVLHLHVFPLEAKRMCAMAVRVCDRYAILLAKDSRFPPQAAYYVAHEIGHIALGHLVDKPALVDLADPLSAEGGSDGEEKAADRYALEILTGRPEPVVLTKAKRFTGAALAKSVLKSGQAYRIEPGTLALCFGHSTGHWDKVTAALKILYGGGAEVGRQVNRLAFSQLAVGGLSAESEEYLRAAAGELS